jgi:hypothetical protein
MRTLACASLFYVPASLVFLAAFAACGDRTGLLVPIDETFEDSGPSGDDGGKTPLHDAGPRDALPPIDVTVPHDAFNNCPDASETFVYVVSEEFELLSFYPPTATFTPIGTLDCPVLNTDATPFSMAVDKGGTAFVLYSDGELFRVSTVNAACQPTSFVPGQNGVSATFGMGFSQDTNDPGETLYVASEGTGATLGSIDTNNFNLRVIGPFQPSIPGAELSGTAAGDLFAFFGANGTTPCNNSNGSTCPDSAIGQIDKTTGTVTGGTFLEGLAQGGAWAFAFWGGDFYTFTAPAGATIVTRFSPSDGSAVTVAQRQDRIVGAGVSTCAPAQ